jgi:hypothetical protein
MPTHNPSNERIKRRYFTFLKEAKRHSEPTVDAVAKALARFEADTGIGTSRRFTTSRRSPSKNRLAEQRGQRSGQKLSKATLHSTLAHHRVMAAIDTTGLPARSRQLDRARGKPYWATRLEMAARSFESYVVAKLQDQGASNDYLANIVSKEYWDAAAALGMEKENTYPYPDASELPAIRAAFDEFFKTVETKETERGVAMFSRTGGAMGRFTTLSGRSAGADQALRDAERMTGLGFNLPIESINDTKRKDVPAHFDLRRRVIVVNTAAKPSRAEAAQFVAEELLHAVDAVAANRTLSASSSLLEPGGAIDAEVRAHFTSAGEYAQFLFYPLGMPDLTVSETRAELFARLGVLYFAQPDALARTLPKTYGAYHAAFRFEATGPLGNGRVLRQVQDLPPNAAQTGGQSRDGAGVPGRPAGSDRQGRADTGLERLRRDLVQAFGTRPRGGIVQFSQLRTEAPRLEGLSISKLRAAVQPILQRWKNAPQVVFVSSMRDAAVPQAVRDYDSDARSQGATGEPEGFWYGGKVYLVADGIASSQRAVTVLLHESLGHHGLRGVYGEALTPILKQIATMRRREVAAKAAQYGLDMGKEADRLVAAEEVLAEMAEQTPTIGFVRRAIAAIRTWLRSHGFSLRLTDDEIINSFIIPARNFVERGGKALSEEAIGRQPDRQPKPGEDATGLLPNRLFQGRQSVNEPTRFSRAGPEWVAHGSAALKSAASKIETFAPEKPIGEKVKALTENWKLRLIQGLVDAYAPLKALDLKAYMLARLSKGADGVVEGITSTLVDERK